MNFYKELLTSYSKLKKRELYISLSEAEGTAKKDDKEQSIEQKPGYAKAKSALNTNAANQLDPNGILGKNKAGGDVHIWLQKGTGRVLLQGLAGTSILTVGASKGVPGDDFERLVSYYSEEDEGETQGSEAQLSPEEQAIQDAAVAGQTYDNLREELGLTGRDPRSVDAKEKRKERDDKLEEKFPGYDRKKEGKQVSHYEQSVASEMDPVRKKETYKAATNFVEKITSGEIKNLTDDGLTDFSSKISISPQGVAFQDTQGNLTFIKHTAAGGRTGENDYLMNLADQLGQEIERRNAEKEQEFIPTLGVLTIPDSGGGDFANRGPIAEAYVAIGLHVDRAAEFRKGGNDKAADKELNLAVDSFTKALKNKSAEKVKNIFHAQYHQLLIGDEDMEDQERVRQTVNKLCGDRGLSEKDCNKLRQIGADTQGGALLLLAAVNRGWNKSLYEHVGAKPDHVFHAGGEDSEEYGEKDDFRLRYFNPSSEVVSKLEESLGTDSVRKGKASDFYSKKELKKYGLKADDEIVETGKELKILSDKKSRWKGGESTLARKRDAFKGLLKGLSKKFAETCKTRLTEAGFSFASAKQLEDEDEATTKEINAIFKDPEKREEALNMVEKEIIKNIEENMPVYKEGDMKNNKRRERMLKEIGEINTRLDAARGGSQGEIDKFRAEIERRKIQQNRGLNPDTIEGRKKEVDVTTEKGKKIASWVSYHMHLIAGSNKETHKVKRNMTSAEQTILKNNETIANVTKGLSDGSNSLVINGNSYAIKDSAGNTLMSMSIEWTGKNYNNFAVSFGKIGEVIADQQGESFDMSEYFKAHMKLLETFVTQTT